MIKPGIGPKKPIHKIALDVYGEKMVFNMIIERIAALNGTAGSLNRPDGVLASTVTTAQRQTARQRRAVVIKLFNQIQAKGIL